MPSRRKLDRDRINELLMTTCPHCDSKMQFADCKRVDGEHLECSNCGQKFIPGRDNRG
jgi:transcription elongation factor Elf1